VIIYAGTRCGTILFSLSLRDDDDEVGTESERYITGEVSAGAMRVNSFLIKKKSQKNCKTTFSLLHKSQTTNTQEEEEEEEEEEERKEEQPPTTPGEREREREKRKHTFPPTNTNINKQRHEL
jgi:hypothetical protein